MTANLAVINPRWSVVVFVSAFARAMASRINFNHLSSRQTFIDIVGTGESEEEEVEVEAKAKDVFLLLRPTRTATQSIHRISYGLHLEGAAGRES